MSITAPEKLAGYFLEWQLIEDEKAALADRSKDLFKAMKDEGFDTKAARGAFREKRTDLIATSVDIAKAEEAEATLDLYRTALASGLASRAHPAPAHIETLNNFPPHGAVTGELTEGQEQPRVETHDAEACSPNSNAVDPASIRPDGRANPEHVDVDRSAERASSAVEIGATNSPERARSMSMTPIEPREANGLKGFGFTVTFEDPAPTPSKAAGQTGGEATPPASSPVVQFTNPRCQQPDACHFVHTKDDCFDCSLAWPKRPRDEQVRLWAEANAIAEVAA